MAGSTLTEVAAHALAAFDRPWPGLARVPSATGTGAPTRRAAVVAAADRLPRSAERTTGERPYTGPMRRRPAAAVAASPSRAAS